MFMCQATQESHMWVLFGTPINSKVSTRVYL
jgi:hypothetical protein